MHGTAQQSAAAAAYTRTDLAHRIRRESALRTHRVRRTVQFRMTDEDVSSDISFALGTGFYLALLTKFSAARGLTAQWWIQQRRLASRHGKDRRFDLQIILQTHPDFADYVTPLTDDEIVSAAKLEYRDAIASGGTDYHQLESQRKNSRGVGDVQMLQSDGGDDQSFRVVAMPSVTTALLDAADGGVDFVDPTAQDRVENVMLHDLMNNDADPLGPVATRVAAIALREYGPTGLFWLVESLFLPRRYTEVLRTLAGTEDEVGAAEFERIKRDMVRKLPEVHLRMMELLRADPETRRIVELIEDGRVTPRQTPAPTSRPLQQVVEREQERYMKRHLPRLVSRLNAASLTDLVRYVGQLSAADCRTVLHEFVAVSEAPHWVKFLRRLQQSAESLAT